MYLPETSYQSVSRWFDFFCQRTGYFFYMARSSWFWLHNRMV